VPIAETKTVVKLHMQRAATLLQHAKAALARTQPELRHVTVEASIR
jgi:hypothetical protein